MIKRKLGLECGLTKITEDKCFEVRLFGSTVVVEPDVKKIREAIRNLTGDILVKGKERSLPKILLRILPDGLRVKEKQRKAEEKVIPIRKLSYGTFSKSDIQLFAFNHHISSCGARRTREQGRLGWHFMGQFGSFIFRAFVKSDAARETS